MIGRGLDTFPNIGIVLSFIVLILSVILMKFHEEYVKAEERYRDSCYLPEELHISRRENGAIRISNFPEPAKEEKVELKEISIMSDGTMEPGFEITVPFENADLPVSFQKLDPQPDIKPYKGDTEREKRNAKARERYKNASPEKRKELSSKRKAKN